MAATGPPKCARPRRTSASGRKLGVPANSETRASGIRARPAPGVAVRLAGAPESANDLAFDSAARTSGLVRSDLPGDRFHSVLHGPRPTREKLERPDRRHRFATLLIPAGERPDSQAGVALIVNSEVGNKCVRVQCRIAFVARQQGAVRIGGVLGHRRLSGRGHRYGFRFPVPTARRRDSRRSGYRCQRTGALWGRCHRPIIISLCPSRALPLRTKSGRPRRYWLPTRHQMRFDATRPVRPSGALN